MSEEKKTFKPIFDLKQLATNLEAAEVQKDYDHRLVKMVFLGTVFGLMPSGKFYMPWYSPNISEEEAEDDELWRKEAEEELQTIGAYLETGEGDPCDLFAVKIVETETETEEGEIF